MRDKTNSPFTKFRVDRLFTQIMRGMRSGMTIAIMFVVSLLIAIAVAHSTPTIQKCPKIEPSISIVNATGGADFSKASTIEQLTDTPLLKTYANTVIKHVTDRVNKLTACQGTQPAYPKLDIFLVYRSFFAIDREQINLDVENGSVFSWSDEPWIGHKINYAKRLGSPWVNIAITRSPQPVIKVIFVWNERQFVFDQALLSGLRPTSNYRLQPVREDVLDRFAEQYEKSLKHIGTPAEELIAEAGLEKRIPADILWLCRNSSRWGSRAGPFSYNVSDAMYRTLNLSANKYTELTNTLVDRFFSSTQTELNYRNIFDLKRLFNIKRYRLTKSQMLD